MKKFISVIPLQKPEYLKAMHYTSKTNETLANDIETSFPIMVTINNDVSSGEKIKVVSILTEYEQVKTNYERFKSELSAIADKKGFEYELEEIFTPYDENIDVHLNLFSDIIEKIEKNDELTACITFGTKPTPMILSCALNFAKNSVEGTDISKIIYGRLDHNTNEGYIHDVAALFYMNSVVDQLGRTQVADPVKLIKTMLDL